MRWSFQGAIKVKMMLIYYKDCYNKNVHIIVTSIKQINTIIITIIAAN
jgi:hypothetical protein